MKEAKTEDWQRRHERIEKKTRRKTWKDNKEKKKKTRKRIKRKTGKLRIGNDRENQKGKAKKI